MSLRDTKQRHAIKRAFQRAGRPLSPKEVLVLATREVPNLGIATVYRNIKTMLGQEELEQIPIPGQSPRYRLPGAPQQNLFICGTTDKVLTFEGAVDAAALNLPSDCEVESVQIIAFGRLKNEFTQEPIVEQERAG